MRAPYKRILPRAESLIAVDCFRHLSAGQRDELIPHLEGRLYDAKQEIVSREDEARDVYFLISGKVQATLLSRTGRVITFQELRAGEMFGEIAAIDGGPRSASIVTMTECLVVKLAACEWWRVVRTDYEFAAGCLRRLAGLSRYLCDRVAELHALSVPDRIKVEIYRLAMLEHGNSNRIVISPCPTQSEIASRVGTHREAVTREFAALAEQGLLQSSRKQLVVTDFDSLSRVARSLIC